MIDDDKKYDPWPHQRQKERSCSPLLWVFILTVIILIAMLARLDMKHCEDFGDFSGLTYSWNVREGCMLHIDGREISLRRMLDARKRIMNHKKQL